VSRVVRPDYLESRLVPRAVAAVLTSEDAVRQAGPLGGSVRGKLFLIVVVLLLAGALSYAVRTGNIERVRENAQKVLDTKLEANTLKVDQLHVPSLAFVPFVGPSSWKSYFFIADKNGRPLDLEKCPTTVDYEVRLSSTGMISNGGKMAVQVYLERLQECSRALQAN